MTQGQIGITEDIRTLIDARRTGDALVLAKRRPLAVRDSQVSAICDISPLEASRLEVLRILARVAQTEPAILDSLRAEIGADENDWDLATPAKLRQRVEQHTKLVG